MNIAYISTDFGVPIFGYKGASRHVREVVTAFSRAGHGVWLVSPAVDEGARTEGGSNFGEGAAKRGAVQGLAAAVGRMFPAASAERLHLLSLPPVGRHLDIVNDLLVLDGFLGRSTSIRQELRSILYNQTVNEGALEYLLTQRIDFIYERYAAFSYAGIEVARALGIPHLLEVNAPLVFEHQQRRGVELRELALDAERRIFLETDHVIVVSNELRSFVTSCGVPTSRVSVIPNAVDPDRFAPRGTGGRDIRSRYGLDGARVIGFVGSLKPWHGVQVLIEAFQRLHSQMPETCLLIVGDGPERQALERRIGGHGLGDAVRFTGNVAPEDVPNHVAAMDVAAAPYLRSDGFYYSPLKIFEYMAMARPVVAGNIGQVGELLRDEENGLLFEPGNVEELTGVLARLVKDPQLCERIGEKARAYVLKEHSWERNAQRLVELASSLIDQAKTRTVARWS